MSEAVPYRKFLRTYRKSEVIFEENSSGREMYIIHSGNMKISTRAPGHEVALARMGPGEFFGEMALCDSEPRTATATAEEDDTSLVAIDQHRSCSRGRYDVKRSVESRSGQVHT